MLSINSRGLWNIATSNDLTISPHSNQAMIFDIYEGEFTFISGIQSLRSLSKPERKVSDGDSIFGILAPILHPDPLFLIIHTMDGFFIGISLILLEILSEIGFPILFTELLNSSG